MLIHSNYFVIGRVQSNTLFLCKFALLVSYGVKKKHIYTSPTSPIKRIWSKKKYSDYVFRVTSDYGRSVNDWTVCHCVSTLHKTYFIYEQLVIYLPLQVKPEDTTRVWISSQYVGNSAQLRFQTFFVCYFLLKLFDTCCVTL